MKEENKREIDSLIAEIYNDMVSGSTTITKKSLSIIEKASEYMEGSQDLSLLKYISNDIIKAKPSMAALEVIISRAVKEIISNYENEYPGKIIRKVRSDMDAATNRTIKKAVDKLFRQLQCNKVMTCSFSSTVLKIFKKALEEDYKFTVLALESIIDDHSYGENVKSSCSEFGIKSKIISGDAIRSNLKITDCILIGADSIYKHGGAVNGYPSYKLASANTLQTPFFIAAESFKRRAKYHLDKGYDYIPAELITEVISDSMFEKSSEL